MHDHPVAIVTGASRGIGFAITQKLLGMGYSVMMTARDARRLETAASALLLQPHIAPERLVTIPADAGDEQMLRWVVTQTLSKWGRLDLLVNNAGMGIFGAAEALSTADWDRVMAVNVRAPFILSQAAIPHLAKQERAWIVNIASVVAHKGYAQQSLYGASKHALLGMSKALGKELHERGIRVHVISPGGVDTDMAGDARPDLDRSILIQPDAIADAVAYLLTLPPSAAVDEICIRRNGTPPWS